MIICAVLWSIAGIFMKKIPWNGLAIASGRAFVAMWFFVIYMAVADIKYVFSKKVLVTALLASSTYICFSVANKLTTAANVIVLQYVSPLFILLYNYLFFHEKIQRRDVIAVLFTMAGLVLCFADGLDSGRMIGNILSIVAGMFFAGMMVFMGNISFEERVSSAFSSQVITFLIGLPAFFITKPEFTVQSILSIIILGVFQIGFAFVFYIKAANSCSALACCLISVLEPILNPVWVMIFDGEKPGVLAVIGAIIVLSSVTIWSITSQKKGKEIES